MRWRPWSRKPETRAVDWFSFGFEAPFQRNASGVAVTATSALGLSAVYASVDLLASSISSLPVDVFVKQGETRRPAPERPVWLDKPDPNPWIDGVAVRTMLMTSLLLHGHAHALTPRDDDGRVTGLVVLDPAAVAPLEGGLVNVEGADLSPFDVLTINGLMLPGSTWKTPAFGVSPITYARETLGLALAAQSFGAAFFGNGAWPGVIAEVPGQLSPDGQKALKAAWNEVHQGAGNAHRIGVLTEGAKLNKLTIPPEDAQFIETRRFEVSDVARLFRVPPHLIGDASGSTSWGSGLAEQNVAFAQHSLRPWVTRVENALGMLHLLEGADPSTFMRLNMGAVLRGSQRERYESYKVALEAGFLTVDEVRQLEDLPPLQEVASE